MSLLLLSLDDDNESLSLSLQAITDDDVVVDDVDFFELALFLLGVCCCCCCCACDDILIIASPNEIFLLLFLFLSDKLIFGKNSSSPLDVTPRFQSCVFFDSGKRGMLKTESGSVGKQGFAEEDCLV